MKDLTVACVWVNGHVPFGVEYVEKLRSMAWRWIDREFEFVCFTDRPAMMPPGVRPIEIRLQKGLKGWWAKLELFNKRHGLNGRVLYLDLDTLIVDSLDEIIDFPVPFAPMALAPHAGTFEGKDGLAVVKRFNSSVMVWDAGTVDYLYDEWKPPVAAALHGDQDWIGLTATNAVSMPLSWFPRISQFLDGSRPSKDAKIVLMKTPKNVEAAKRMPWVHEAWS